MNKINSLNDVIERLQYKADNIKAKLDPEYFSECVSYLKDLQQKENATWIPCDKQMPKEWEIVQITVIGNATNKPVTSYDAAYMENGEWHWFGDRSKITVEVIAWQKYNKPEPYKPKQQRQNETKEM